MGKIKKFKVGLKQIIIEVVSGLLTTLILKFLSNSGILPDNVALFINIFLIIGNILLAKSMLSWGMFYTVGWLIGSWVFFEIGLFEPWDFVLYIVVPIVVIVARVTLVIKKSIKV
jgi:hypothetical protein